MNKDQLKEAFQELFTEVDLLSGKPDYYLHLNNHFKQLIDTDNIGEDEYIACISVAENLKTMRELNARKEIKSQLYIMVGKILVSGFFDKLTKII